MIDYEKLYRECEAFKIYVDKCCKADGLTVEQELKKVTVKSVGDYYMENGQGKVVSETINVGCGGC